MARTLTTKDCYALINAIAAEITGQQGTLQAVDSSSFVSVGETILAAGTENTLNAISLVLGRTFMAVRPYKAKLWSINAIDSGVYANRLRKISFYARKAEPTGAWNTDLFTNHAMGFDNGSNPDDGVPQSVPSMWKQNAPVPLELNFGGSSAWDDSTTIYEKQLQVAFRSEADFAAFMSGIMTEKGNDIETEKEAFNRACMLNYIAGVYDLSAVNGGAAIDLAAGFNTKNGTSYTRAQLLTTYYKDFLAYFVATVKVASDMLENRSLKWHWSPAKQVNGEDYVLLRHTPKADQKLLMYKPFWIDAEANVFSEVFNEQYLKPENYEGVMFWQNELNPTAIKVTPAIPNTANPASQKAGSQVALDYVLGVLYDRDAMMTDFQFEGAYSTPLEARKLYRNTIWHFRKNILNDFTENGIVFYIGAGGDA